MQGSQHVLGVGCWVFGSEDKLREAEEVKGSDERA